MVKFLLESGISINKEDKKGVTPTSWAKKLNRSEILSILLEKGGQISADPRRPKTDNRRPQKTETAPEPKPPVVNEKKIPKRYMLTKLREGGFYSPMTDAEFDDFKRQNPDIAPYFETDEDGGPLQSLSALQVPEVPESALIFDQWEKAAQRMMQNLYRNPKSYIF